MSGALFLIILLFLKKLLFCILFKLIPGAGLSVDELAAAAPHTIHFLLQTAAVPEFHFFVPSFPSLHFMMRRQNIFNIQKHPAMVQPWENVGVGIKLLCHPCNLLQVCVRPELVRQKLLSEELLVELKPTIDIVVQCQRDQDHYWTSTYLWCLKPIIFHCFL